MPQYPVPQYVDVIAPKQMPAKKNKVVPEKLKGKALVKEVNRRIRLAQVLGRSQQRCDASRANEGSRTLSRLTKEEREQVPQTLRVWLRYRSEKYFGDGVKGPGGSLR